jgi:hypothetical protein
MLKVKDTLRATVNLTFDGRVIKSTARTLKAVYNEIRIPASRKKDAGLFPVCWRPTPHVHYHDELRSRGTSGWSRKGTVRRVGKPGVRNPIEVRNMPIAS